MFTAEMMKDLKNAAATLGRAAGVDAAAQWTRSRPDLKSQNVPKSVGEEAAKMLAMCDECDPAVDYWWPRVPNLSGEYADDPTPARLYAWLGVDADADTDDMELCQAYEDAASEAMNDAVIGYLQDAVEAAQGGEE
tara:strand:- start:47 stop:454 length:408 start_codon:yes stop_codon:yes gene_type:complete